MPGRLHLGLIGHLKAKKGALLLLDALRRSGRADAVQLLLAGEPAPELEAWLAEHVGAGPRDARSPRATGSR